MKLTNNQVKILLLLRDNVEGTHFISPTMIGMAVGDQTFFGLQRHSAWACPILKRLVERGFVERSGLGHYRIRQAGKQALYNNVQDSVKSCEVFLGGRNG